LDNNYPGKKWKQYPMSKNLIILINNFGVIIRKECVLKKIPENRLNGNTFLSKKIG